MIPGWILIVINVFLFLLPIVYYLLILRWQKDYLTRTILRYLIRSIIILIIAIIVGWQKEVTWYSLIGFLVIIFLNNILFKGESKSDSYKW